LFFDSLEKRLENFGPRRLRTDRLTASMHSFDWLKVPQRTRLGTDVEELRRERSGQDGRLTGVVVELSLILLP